MLCNPGPQTKIGRVMGILLFSGIYKSSVTFLVLVRGNFFVYHLKAYLYDFILSRDTNYFFIIGGQIYEQNIHQAVLLGPLQT